MRLKPDRKQWRNWFWIGLLCATSFGVGWLANARISGNDVNAIKTAYKLIANEALFNEQTSQELAYTAIRGMLSSINDPYAELIEPTAAQGILDTFAGKTGVVGLYAENQNGEVVILSIFPNGAAEKAGICTGDVILEIDDMELDADADSSETGLLIRGAPGTIVRLKIRRSDEILEFALLREEREFVTARMLPEGIGYIYLSAFNATASQKMRQALESILAQDPKALIWDMRGNEGGDMQAAQVVLSYFIEDGLLFTAQLTQNRTVEFHTTGKALDADIPLVVLMDESTYSAGETAAAVIAETGRGTTIGSNSYGKGIIQATIPLPDDSLLQMTIAKWLSTNGEWYQERGVAPQVAARDNPDTEADEVLDKAVEFLLSAP